MKRIIVSLIFLSACDEVNQKKHLNPPPKNELNNAIIGKWGGLGEERPVWEITNDSFYFKVTSKVTTYEIFKNDVKFITQK